MSLGLDALVAQVVAADTCTGCGACTRWDPGLEMALSPAGFLRPRRAPGSTTAPGAAQIFARSCPGLVVAAARPSGTARHAVLGPVLEAWEARAVDPAVRERGASGGVLTALTGFALAAGDAERTVSAAMDSTAPRRTVAVQITTKEQALAAAGSRYAPVAVAGAPGADDPANAVVAKPCEVSALAAGARAQGRPAPLLLSFFCAGTPSQHATDALLTELGVAPDDEVDELWYRGRGWPGRFTARTSTGGEVSASYEESWGGTLGRDLQWRCKICPDGVGESADVTAGDLWRSDARGYPVFDQTDGYSALVARTPRGLDLVRRAVDAGVIEVRSVDADEVAAVQPLHRRRRRTLFGRLAGARLAGARVPSYRGFDLACLALRHPREALQTARGTFARVRASRGARP